MPRGHDVRCDNAGFREILCPDGAAHFVFAAAGIEKDASAEDASH